MVLQIDSGSDHQRRCGALRVSWAAINCPPYSFVEEGEVNTEAELRWGLICQQRDDLGIINIAITVEWTHKYWLQIHSASPPNLPPTNPPAASQLRQGQEASPANTLNFLLFPYYRICNSECISFIFFDWSNSDYVFSMGFERSIEYVKGKGWSVNYELSSSRKYLKIMKDTFPIYFYPHLIISITVLHYNTSAGVMAEPQ